MYHFDSYCIEMIHFQKLTSASAAPLSIEIQSFSARDHWLGSRAIGSGGRNLQKPPNHHAGEAVTRRIAGVICDALIGAKQPRGWPIAAL
jgi:hypothetical protein